MFIVEYKFVNEANVITKSFTDFISAMKFQGEIVKKYKSKLEYCIYKY